MCDCATMTKCEYVDEEGILTDFCLTNCYLRWIANDHRRPQSCFLRPLSGMTFRGYTNSGWRCIARLHVAIKTGLPGNDLTPPFPCFVGRNFLKRRFLILEHCGS